ncbi:MAG: ATP-dependent DNA helicase RecG [Candidatus Niyogibacteria bacterium]|nr:ATP-dependent DNA helicase RecG [Candidatus Niyogibacteria bacterium]
MHLDDPLELHLRLTPKQKERLLNAGLKTARDILWRFPARYESFHEPKAIRDLAAGDRAVITGHVVSAKITKTFRTKIALAETVIDDGTGKIRAIWFNQPYIAKTLKPEIEYSFAGRVGEGKRGLFLANPKYRAPGSFVEETEQKTLTPVYPESRGVTSEWLAYAAGKLLEKFSGLPAGEAGAFDDPIPHDILARYKLPSLKTALHAIHKAPDARIALAARKRFAFEEIFLIQLDRQKIKMARSRSHATPVRIAPDAFKPFLSSLPFALTNAQKAAIKAVLTDISRPLPMARLLEGDVGSGKTIVAAIAAYACAKSGHQIAYMAPTEILARQHYQDFCAHFAPYRIPVGLITSSECRRFPSKAFPTKDTHTSRAQFLKWAASGEIPIIIGTHALIQDSMKFRKLALAVIDEQHRFGVAQRARLAEGSPRRTHLASATALGIPHLLSMTATPIPRTLALTLYGDLELTLIDEMPAGRKKIITTVVPPALRARAYEQMRSEIKKGRQAYIICPRIEENSASTRVGRDGSDSEMVLEMKSVKAEHKKLSRDVFPEFNVEMLHGKMLPKEKERVMRDFRAGKIHVLIATSVIEVGVNVPNATLILIEGADRFGLAQLHQLRGRVLRGTHQPYCFVFTDSTTARTLTRLQALVEAKNGFELAEYDLKFRGAGELSGSGQWGISDAGMEALKNIKMVEAARAEARALLERDPELGRHPRLKSFAARFENLHFE